MTGPTWSLPGHSSPAPAVTTEGRPSDLSALVLISPKPEGFGYVLGHVVASLAPRVPLLLLAGERDTPSKDAVQSAQQVVQRTRLNKVELFPSSLHGYKFLRLEPKITSALFQFLDTSLKNRPIEWEPQYNLTPVTFSDPQMVLNARPSDSRKDQSKAKEPGQERRPPAPSKKADADNPRKTRSRTETTTPQGGRTSWHHGPRNPTDPTRSVIATTEHGHFQSRPLFKTAASRYNSLWYDKCHRL